LQTRFVEPLSLKQAGRFRHGYRVVACGATPVIRGLDDGRRPVA